MTEADRQATNPYPPTQSATPGEGITLLTTSTTAVAHDMGAYDGMFQRYVDFSAGAQAIWIAFGAAATPVIDKSNAGAATLAGGTETDNAIKIAVGATVTFRLHPINHRYLHVQADSATPILTIRPSSQEHIGS